MSAIIIDGKFVANQLLNSLQNKIKTLQEDHHIIPGLAIILVGKNPASEIYVNNKIKIANQIGIHSFLYQLPVDVLEKNIINKIDNLNNDPKIHGILVQLPLPKALNKHNIINKIDHNKDVDGLNVNNIGKLVSGQNALIPATAKGCIKLIKSIKSNLSGLKAVIIGRSELVGKPVAHLLLNENCSVTIIHSHSLNIEYELANADIIVIAIGSSNFLKKDLVKTDSIIIDVGINKDENNKITGDVDFDEVSKKVSYITPVPGGVGPMTIACLLENVLIASYASKNMDYKSLI